MRLTLGEVAGAAAGEILAGDPALELASVSVDSRRINAGGLFVALRAERDGHEFANGAVAAGAVAVLVERPVAGLPPDAGVVRVADTGVALGALGAHARARLGEAVPVVGITGSTGKTSTKDLTAAALGSRLAVSASPASWNNEIGVPLTLLGTEERAGAVVLEMGSRRIGHIAALAAMARPRVGVITNVGIAHAEFFGSRAEVARAKGELVEALPPGGTAVLSADDDTTPALAGRTRATVLTAGLDPSADVAVSNLRLDADLRPSFHLDTPWGALEVGPIPVRGAHQATNAALAVAVAGALGVDLEAAATGLTSATGSAWRMELSRTPAGLVVLNDAYNANPASMAAALRALQGLNGGGRRFAVLGHMAELGAVSDEEHRRIGRLAASAGVVVVVAVGREAAPLAEGAAEAGAAVVHVESSDAALAVLAGQLRSGDVVLVKASRVVGLEALAAALCTLDFGDTPNPESSGDTPNPESSGDTPNPESSGDTPHPESSGDTPHPESSGDTPHPESSGDTPHPGGRPR
jgi:UDP-N-acetylmuramoyl-tripeptide--D-alanyl-D-alanine ligase